MSDYPLSYFLDHKTISTFLKSTMPIWKVKLYFLDAEARIPRNLVWQRLQGYFLSLMVPPVAKLCCQSVLCCYSPRIAGVLGTEILPGSIRNQFAWIFCVLRMPISVGVESSLQVALELVGATTIVRPGFPERNGWIPAPQTPAQFLSDIQNKQPRH